MGRKLKIYLDTSVISHLWHDDAPEQMAATRRLWESLGKGEYEASLSQVTVKELYRCPEPIRSALLENLAEIQYLVLPLDKAVEAFAIEIVAAGILTPRNVNDCLHIAAATVHGCDCLVSWDLKHIVRRKTIEGVKALAVLGGYKSIDIVTPLALLGRKAIGYEC